MVQARKPGTVMYNVIAPAITLSRINLCIDGHFHFFIPSPARRLQPEGLDGRYLDRWLLRGRRMGGVQTFPLRAGHWPGPGPGLYWNFQICRMWKSWEFCPRCFVAQRIIRHEGDTRPQQNRILSWRGQVYVIAGSAGVRLEDASVSA
jgi:hypothetical protein